MNNDTERQGILSTCIRCGKPFVISADELAWNAAHGWAEPKRCQPCRTERRAEREREAQR